jgi:hypothetical protein
VAKTVEQLEQEIENLGLKRAAVAEKMRAVNAERETLLAIEDLATMPEARRKALGRIIGDAGGIESQEAVGTPGASALQ